MVCNYFTREEFLTHREEDRDAEYLLFWTIGCQ